MVHELVLFLCTYFLASTPPKDEVRFGNASSYSPLVLAFCGSDLLLMLTLGWSFSRGYEQLRKYVQGFIQVVGLGRGKTIEWVWLLLSGCG